MYMFMSIGNIMAYTQHSSYSLLFFVLRLISPKFSAALTPYLSQRWKGTCTRYSFAIKVPMLV